MTAEGGQERVKASHFCARHQALTAEQERLLQLWRDALETLVSWLDTERDALNSRPPEEVKSA